MIYKIITIFPIDPIKQTLEGIFESIKILHPLRIKISNKKQRWIELSRRRRRRRRNWIEVNYRLNIYIFFFYRSEGEKSTNEIKIYGARSFIGYIETRRWLVPFKFRFPMGHLPTTLQLTLEIDRNEVML